MLQIAAFVAPIFASMPDVFADELVGQASIIDGDTLARIRRWSVDAPQIRSSSAGAEMMNAPAGGKRRRTISTPSSVTGLSPALGLIANQYGRSVAVRTAAGIDPAEWLVRALDAGRSRST
jgi:endonuclease YncB( thermonuclease family)